MRRPIGAWLALMLLAGAGSLGAGCASTREVSTPRYTASMPGEWQVRAEGKADGLPTTVVIPRGAAEPPAPVEVELRIYAWPEPSPGQEATQQAAALLAGEPTLQLNRHLIASAETGDCKASVRSYRLLGGEREPLDLVSRPGWRTILVGGTGRGSLLAVVGRIDHDDDHRRFCQNLQYLQAQLQRLLDGVEAVTPPPTVAPTPPPPPREESLPLRPY